MPSASRLILQRELVRSYRVRGARGGAALLGDEAFGAGWAEGQAMTLEEAVAYALKGE